MPSEAKLLLTTQTEKPAHYRYLKEFRVEQCQLFPLHKCTQHRPFTCFNWHFPNQKRRRPVRKRDGTFNYSPDTYCTKFDETNGICPDGDECPFLHRTAGDTERRYHLRYFKTSMCVYETDNRGSCTKNGVHCAFAHGEIDKRPPVFDIRELQQQQQTQEPIEESLSNGFSQLDKERNLLIDDPKWQDANYVLVHYKTEPCKRPPRLCRQGYACPQYHNLRDRRRSPKKHKYRSTPCPNVKNTDEWGEPTACMDGDDCSYCHTRTEQQFHPEIYKSSKCNDVFTNQYCPRGPFCAFAHADHEMSINRNMPSDTNLADILSNVLPGNTSSNTALGLGLEGSESNNLNLISNTNNNETIDYMGLAMNKPGNEFSDALIDSPELYQFGLNSSNFGAQSFASAVSSYSNVASASSGMLNGKYFDLDSIKKGLDEMSNGPIGGSLKNNLISNAFGLNSGVLDNINDYLQEDREGYSLFPSSSKIWDDVYGVETGRDESRDDSPNTIDKELEGELFAGGDIANSSGGTKPVSIPTSGFYSRERFPSGTSPISSGLAGLNFTNLFSKSESIDHNDILNNQQQRSSFFDSFVSPKNVMESSRGTSNGFNSSGVERGPSASSNSSSNGPIGHNGSEDGFNGGTQSPIISVVGRSDLVYLSVQTLTQLKNSYKIQLEAIHKALNSHKKDSKHYPCLQCKHKDRARTIILVPCDHQVLCKICAPMTTNCPLCRAVIRNRKQMSSLPGNDL